MPKKKNPITDVQKMKVSLLLGKRATAESLDSLLSSGVLADLLDSRASTSVTSRSALRAILGLPEIMEVNYDLPFDSMMIQAGIPEKCIRKIRTKLEGNEIRFDYSGLVTFEYEDVHFGNEISTAAAIEHIDNSDPSWRWQPFCVAHLLVYIRQHPERFYAKFAVAIGKTIKIDGKEHVFAVGTLDKKPHLDLVPASGHNWKRTFGFPQCRKV